MKYEPMQKTSTRKMPAPVAAGTGELKPSGRLDPQESSLIDNKRQRMPQVKLPFIDWDARKSPRVESECNGAIHRHAKPKKSWGRAFSCVRTIVALALIVLLAVCPLSAAPLGQYQILIADSWGTVYLFNPRTGERVIVSQWGVLDRPYKLILSRNGNTFVSDTGKQAIVLLNARTGRQTVIAQDPVRLGTPWGFDGDNHNRLFVANGVKVVCIHLDSGEIQAFAEGGLLQAPLDVIVEPGSHSLLVADALAGIVRIHMGTKEQTLVATGGYLHNPVGLTLDRDNRTLLVADPGGQCVVAVDLHTKSQRMVAQGGLLTTPVMVVPGPGGSIFISDPDGFLTEGGVIAVDRDGNQTGLMKGFGDLTNPRGFAIVVGRF